MLSNLSVADRQSLRKHLYGVRIRLVHRPTSRIEMFDSLTTKSAAETTFEKDGRQISVAQYFKDIYNYTVRFRNAPCVKLRGGKGTYVPIELCYVLEGNRVPPLSLNAAQTATMIDVARQQPPERQTSVNRLRNEVVRYEADTLLQSWGVDVESEPVAVKGRQLPPPKVVYGQQKADSPRDGAWNLMGKRFIAPQQLVSWAVVNFSRVHDGDAQAFGRQLQECLTKLGIPSRPPVFASFNFQQLNAAGGAKQALMDAGKQAFHAANKQPPQLFVCLMEPNNTGLYDDIKRAGMDLPLPTPSQCVNVNKAKIGRGVSDQYFANVGMKINVKLGGGNHTVSPQDMPNVDATTMLMGADVTHPPPMSGLDSIAASVATVDGGRVVYGHEVRLQRNPGRGQSQEIILAMKEMVKGHLVRWKARNQGKLPTSILIFRDGISEGQFAAAKGIEAKAIRDAVFDMDPKHRLKLTFIVCGKRHHVRFSSKDGAGVDKNQNLRAGTVVDTDVANPVCFEFFLQAHAGLIGTAKPTRYIVLEDDNKFSSDALQTVVNSLCYTYSRATRSVSLPPPAYYSDILAEKARILAWGDIDARSLATGSSDDNRPPLDEVAATKIMVQIRRKPGFDATQWYM